MASIRIITTGVLALAAACVPHVGIDGAPCPCPKGFVCCPTLGTCVQPGTPCPAVYPPSSQESCSRDHECPANEVCLAWTFRGDAALLGPRRCFRACTPEHACASGEGCALVPHDGGALESLTVATACAPVAVPAGCAGLECAACPVDRVGQTFCSGDVFGCLLGIHPTCGLACNVVLVTDCTFDTCTLGADGATCNENTFGPDPCVDYPCAACAEEPLVRGLTCDGADLVQCTSMPYEEGESCDEICVRDVQQSCASACVDAPSPHCAD